MMDFVPDGGSALLLFLIHDGSCSAEQVGALTRQLSGTATVVALPVVGPEPAQRTVEGMALRLARSILAVQPAGPYRIAGWSLGGIVSCEVAGLLLGRDKPVEFLTFIHPPDAPSEASAGAGDALAAHRYVPPPLPVAVHLFAAAEAGDGSPWRAWGAAQPRTRIRRIPVSADAFPSRGLETGALAGARAGEIRRAGEGKAKGAEEPHSSTRPGSGAHKKNGLTRSQRSQRSQRSFLVPFPLFSRRILNG